MFTNLNTYIYYLINILSILIVLVEELNLIISHQILMKMRIIINAKTINRQYFFN